MTRYRGGLNKGDVIAANKLIADRARNKAKQVALAGIKDPAAPAHKAFVPGGSRKPAANGTPRGNNNRHKKNMKARYNTIYGTAWHPCTYCGVWLKPGSNRYTLDHLIPLSSGGSNHPQNHHPACTDCNGDKAQLLPYEWLNVLKRRYDTNPQPRTAYMVMRLQMLCAYADEMEKILINKK